MKTVIHLALAALMMLAPGATAAFPDGAPWSAAEGEGCASCHFDGPLRAESEAIEVDGLPEQLRPEKRYQLTIRFTHAPMETAGFLLAAEQTEGRIGTFETEVEDGSVETQGALARSSAPEAAIENDGQAVWIINWRTPARIDGPVRLILWANAGNGDASPFGDSIHRRTILLRPAR